MRTEYILPTDIGAKIVNSRSALRHSKEIMDRQKRVIKKHRKLLRKYRNIMWTKYV